MVFSSLVFLCAFIPIVFTLHLLLPNNHLKNALLIIASFLFYAYGEPVYVFLMILSVLGNYLGARLIHIGKDPKTKKIFLTLTVILNLAILCVFKYTGFIIHTINQLGHLHIKDPKITLPIGISFFTFQAMSYVIDVYRDKVDVQKNYLKLFLYISFFPQLIAGPIVKYRDIANEIDNRVITLEETTQGLRRFICGLGKKIIIANTMGSVADKVFTASPSQIGILTAWIGAIAYMFQIYYDFSGYSDMAIGLGKMFGFHFKENFQYPYAARNIQEFWRRWHISLSSWFRDYVYIPLGGNRKGRGRTVLNKITVFFLTGLWHGANWTFVIWGLYHGFFLLLEEYIPILRKLPKVIGHLYNILVVCIGFVIFRAENIGQGLFMIKRMFLYQPMSSEGISFAIQQLSPWFLFAVMLAVIGAGPIRMVADRIRQTDKGKEAAGVWTKVSLVLYPLSILLLAWCILRLSGNSYNPFIYFRF